MGVSRRYHVNIKGVSKGLNGWQALCLRTFGLSYDTDIKCIIIVITTIIIIVKIVVRLNMVRLNMVKHSFCSPGRLASDILKVK